MGERECGRVYEWGLVGISKGVGDCVDGSRRWVVDVCTHVCVCVCVCAFTVHERMISFSAHTPEYTAGLSPLPTQRYAPTHPLTCSNRSQRTMERRTDSALSHLNRR